MAVNNPFSIAYGTFEVGGGSSVFLLDGPHVLERSYTTLRVVFDVIVVADSYEDLHAKATELETAFALRDQNLTITLDESSWQYVSGTSLLNVQASALKSGDRNRDRGFARAYTCTVQGELPADDRAGLRELAVHVIYSPSRQRQVTMRGTYTAHAPDSASAAYMAGFDAEAATILTGIGNTAVWELVQEEFTRDRLDHQASFDRQYIEILSDQSNGFPDDDEIRDHRVVFSESAPHPGDSQPGVYRLRRVMGNYDCAVDATETLDLQAVFENKVRARLIALFEQNFQPLVFAIEDRRSSYDETGKRLSVSIQFVYQKAGGDAVLEVAQSQTVREVRSLDYTPTHLGNEYAAYVDIGWATRERITSRTAVVMGEERPRQRISGERAPPRATSNMPSGPPGDGAGSDSLPGSGGGSAAGSGGEVNESGWNTIANMSQVQWHYVGDPGEGPQMLVSTITEQVTERWTERPTGGGGRGGISRTPSDNRTWD